MVNYTKYLDNAKGMTKEELKAYIFDFIQQDNLDYIKSLDISEDIKTELLSRMHDRKWVEFLLINALVN